jgi:hypothetical protein
MAEIYKKGASKNKPRCALKHAHEKTLWIEPATKPVQNFIIQ